MGILEAIIGILIIIWLGGLFFHILGAFIHIFLVLAIIAIALRILGVKI